MQCKDIEERPILEFLFKHKDGWCFNFDPKDCERSVYFAFPKDVPHKLLVSKMRNMIKKGLVDGCDCGCRGDYQITEKGILKLKE